MAAADVSAVGHGRHQRHGWSRLVAWTPIVTVIVLVGPVAAGLLGAAGPAFGWLPALGGNQFSLSPWRELLQAPGLSSMIHLSLVTGLASTILALVIVVLCIATFFGTPTFKWIQRLLSPLLAVPHAAAAIGIAFLLAPSGLVMRLLSPTLTGFEVPADYLFPGDRAGLALITGLVVKEVPFLLLMSLAALPQCQAAQRRQMALALGYAPVTAFFKAVLPSLYPLIRLPVYAVIAFSSANVEVAMILGPSTPSPLAVSVVHWQADPDLNQRFMASAGALLQLGVTLTALLSWWILERIVASVSRPLLENGQRRTATNLGRLLGVTLSWTSIGLLAASLIGLVLWSMAAWWPFPSAWPEPLTFENWQRALGGLTPATLDTLSVALCSSLIAIVLVIGCLESETVNHTRMGKGAMLILYLPLLVPPVAFLQGLVQLQAQLAITPGKLPVILGHCLFVLPYMFLSLAESYRRLDPRWSQLSASLGQSPAMTFLRVRVPMLLAPIAVALAIGLAISIGQYLPTLLLGAGRITTLTTEAVTLASGGDRRLTAVYALAQLMLPALGFALALMLPRLVYRRRHALRH